MSCLHMFYPRFSLCSIIFISVFQSSVLHALSFELDSYEAQVITNLSVGAAWRMDARDQRHLGQLNQNITSGSTVGAPNGASDDGNWNFSEGETYSKIFKGSTEFSIQNERNGIVVGARYFYDYELKNERRAKDETGFVRELNDDTLDQAGENFQLMNAYAHGMFGVDNTHSFKLGRHVVSWGEGLFMQGGVNVINPVDASAARVPGARLQEIFEPVNMLSSTFAINNQLSMEAFFQFEWQRTEVDPCGTYFSFSDVSGDGCGPIILANVPDSLVEGVIASNSGIIPRIEDKEASDEGQFGVALHWYLEQLNGAELGFYYLQYHSRLPYFSGVPLDPFQVSPTDLLPIPGLPSYYVEYPEDIKLYALSFSNSLGGGYSFSAEYSFRENLPIQWNTSEIIYGGLLRLHSRHLQQRMEEAGAVSPLAASGKEIDGYDRYKVSQLQVSTIKLFDNLLAANQLSIMAELGAVYIHGFPENAIARYGRADSLGQGDFNGLASNVYPDINPLNPSSYSCTGANATEAVNLNPSYCGSDGYTTQFSWGYILAMALDYQGVLPSINVRPELYFSHDVKGFGPNPMNLFVEGRKSLGLTLNADYDFNRYQAALGYVRYFGGGRHNPLNDRDHLSFSLGMAF